jgi:3-oxoacyl-[acyl-carrier-protein] synthase II
MSPRPLDDPIVVTGMGALAANVSSAERLFRAALEGRSSGDWLALDGLDEAIAAVRAPDPDLRGAELRYARRLDRSAQLAFAAAREAISAARLVDGIDPDNVGVLIGTSRGPLGRTLEIADDFRDGSIGPSATAESTLASLSGVISQAYGFGGPGATITATCASSATAICMAALHLIAGEADAVVTGGTEAPLNSIMAAQLRAARVTGFDEDPAATCKPFDARRNGLMMGEGAGILVLERLSSAKNRGAPILARLSGWAAGSDDGGRTGVTADGTGLARVTRRALDRANLAPSQIGYVNAHGTATRLNDPVEARVLNSVFGDGHVPPTSSTKPITGHCLGATPALEAIITIGALTNGCLPPTANHERLDDECRLDVIGGSARPTTARAALSTSLGFWGVQAALVFEAP